MSIQTFDTRIGREFAKLVEERQQTITQNVMNGTFTKKDYARHTGRYQGLEEALGLYMEAEAKAKAAERS